MNKKTFIYFISALSGYLVLRVFSFVFQPDNIVNTVVSIAIVIISVILILKKDIRGWFVVVIEMLLGGSGNFLAIGAVSLRTALLVSLVAFIIIKIRDKKFFSLCYNNKVVIILLSLIYTTVLTSALYGYFGQNDTSRIISDIIPYFYFLYYFPLKEFWLDKKFRFLTLIVLTASLVGNLIFVLFTFVLYSSSVFIIQDFYYKFWRDIAGGKITYLQYNFFRIVLNEHLLLIPSLLYLVHLFIRKKIQETKEMRLPIYLATLSGLIILSLNLSRIYLLAFVIGLALLFSIKYFKHWLLYSLASVAIFIISFCSIHYIASSGNSFGLELLGLRLQSVATPNIEQSSLSRMLLLRPIWQQINSSLFIGNGLGSTISVYSPVIDKIINTPHYDWGYLEIWAEMGVLGLLFWLALIIYLGKKHTSAKSYFTVAILGSILVINITSPAFFHVLGIVLFTGLLVSVATKQSFAKLPRR